MRAGTAAAFCRITGGFFSRGGGARARTWLAQFYTGAAGLRQSNRDSLFRVRRPVLSLANVVHFFADKFSCLRAWRLSFRGIFVSAFDCFFFWHDSSPQNKMVQLPDRWRCSSERHRQIRIRFEKTECGNRCNSGGA
jgi:hypothetical protein